LPLAFLFESFSVKVENAMKEVHKDELFSHINDFLKTRGIEMKEGNYSKGVQAGCSLLADAINLSQQGFERAKLEMQRKMDEMRQAIHEKTAPRPAGNPSPATPPPQSSATANQPPPRAPTKPVKKKAKAKVSKSAARKKK
jgi:hypothetical protein